MAALLGNLVYAGLATLLTTQTTVGAINSVANLYSINHGQASGAPPDVALFQPAFIQANLSVAAGVGFGASTLQPLLYTRTGSTTVWYNPNTTAVAGDMLVSYWHSGIR